MFDGSWFIRCCMLMATAIFCFSVRIQALQTINDDLLVIGNFDEQGKSTLRDTLTMQQLSGMDVPFVDFEDVNGTLKGRIFANTAESEVGLNLTTTDTNPIICIKNDGTITLNGDTAVIGNADITVDLKVKGDAQFASLNKGDMSILNTYSYTLGSKVNFGQINDNPGGNINISGIIPGYVVPVAGYYMVSIGLTSNNLIISEITLSNPVCQVEVVKNNTVVFRAYQPMVTTGSLNHHTLTGVIRAQVGDMLCASYTAWAIKLNGSFGSVAGRANLLGGTGGIASFMRVHYISSAVIN